MCELSQSSELSVNYFNTINIHGLELIVTSHSMLHIGVFMEVQVHRSDCKSPLSSVRVKSIFSLFLLPGVKGLNYRVPSVRIDGKPSQLTECQEEAHCTCNRLLHYT